MNISYDQGHEMENESSPRIRSTNKKLLKIKENLRDSEIRARDMKDI